MFISVLIFCVFVSSTVSRVFHLGVLIPYTGDWSKVGSATLQVVQYAVAHVDSDPLLSTLRERDHHFTYHWLDSGCEQAKGLKALVDLWTHPQRVDAFIGPLCDTVCESAGLLAGEWGIPMVSYGCTSLVLSDKSRYPTFARSLSPYTRVAPVVEALMAHFHWDRIAILFSLDQVWSTSASALKRRLSGSGVEANLVSLGHKTDDMLTYNGHGFESIVSQSRVFIIYADTSEVLRVLAEANKLELLNGEYAFITIDVRLDAVGYDQQSSLEGILDISTHFERESDIFKNFVQNVTQGKNETLYPSKREDVHLSLMYDAIRLYADGLNDALHAGVAENDTLEISKYLRNNTYDGLQGVMKVDDEGDTWSDYTIRNIRNGSYIPVLEYFFRNSGLTETGEEIIWPGGSVVTVDGEPTCGWQHEKCQSDILSTIDVTLETSSVRSITLKPKPSDADLAPDTAWILVVSCLAAFIFAAIIGFIIFRIYRSNKRKMELISNAWRINYLDLQMDGLHGSKSQFGSRLSRFTDSPSLPYRRGDSKSYLFSNNNLGRPGTTSSVDLASIDQKSMMGEHRGQVFTNIGHFLGQVIAMKYIRKPYIYLTKEIIQELNQVRNMRHPNLNLFIGACVEPNRISVVSLYCSKGSLQDVLENDNIKLDRIFKLSFASDIAQGMVYIHDSPIVFHGRLKSSNVLVDSRWAAKIGDFGLRKFREGERTHGGYGEHSQFYQLLWTAPEHLREDETSRTGSQKGDVYSYAIILQEIILRSSPFFSASENPSEVIERVQRGEHPPFRPKVPGDEAEEELLDLMRICWEEISAFRPNFVTIRDSLRKMNKGRQTNLVDQMMHMMEIYADHLEDIVDERTKQLIEEQKKTEELLCRMLPKTVAEDLKMGKTIDPESFSSVTIFFSDVVGFTALAAASTPLQVVDFLNDLYICFDNVLEEYDVYKVETIGDAYMVASGLPVKNGIKHAGEICTMALDLLAAVGSFKIRHQQQRQLQLRIGIHTGPVVAGVVGLKMPRYCLFGDTVNYASRMESSGLALRIHVSPECKRLLDNLGGFKLAERGEVSMKGKGTITTYFLRGRDGFNKPLPDLTLAASIKEHEFK